MEAPAKERDCSDCGRQRQRVSRYEWFLADALKRELDQSGREFDIIEQWELEDHRGFSWFFDLAVFVVGSNVFGCSKYLVEIQGLTHVGQKRYSGPGGGYTRDDDKWWEAFSVQRLGKQGFELLEIPNDDCRLAVVASTAQELAVRFIQAADA